jgi:hypothetical protein
MRAGGLGPVVAAALVLGAGGCAGAPVLPLSSPEVGLYTPGDAAASRPDSGLDPDGGSALDSGSPPGDPPRCDGPPHCDGIPTAEHAACCAALDAWCFQRNPYSLEAHEACLFGPEVDGSTGCAPEDLPGGWSG